ncbi:EAL domain-containing protein [Lysinibacillus yapensis]|uniref:histidine kinase n=1 Tax=Ureibacillus yapensis TaxID=2304605 RepID=A0A396SGI5_9BACL|nr:EAL domain-containing protein [Lysinibacillus yapensis]RHW37586.1 EAL domain-containing protein [Lysinibacillus yapensis]
MELIYKTTQVETELKNALEKEEFRLYYQPKVNLSTGKIEGMEALIRWEHPEKGLIPPAEFISFAEDSGLIFPMGEWVLRTACLQNKNWMKAGFSPMVMSVNLSVRQLYQPNIIDMVCGILEETKLAPEYLEIEITESAMVDKKRVIEVIRGLRRLGVQISIDDFGKGYSSLQYLNEFQIDNIKIDQTFIRNCTTNTNNSTIVKMFIEIAQRLNMKVIAEGIETKEELIFLQQNSCNYGQGYLFSRPLPPDELIQFFDKIEQLTPQEGISKNLYNQGSMNEGLESNHQELRDSMSQQQGMTFKFIKKNDKFIHTVCEGKLLYRLGHTSEQVIGKELKDFLPIDIAKEKTKLYHKAWQGEENIMYEGEQNGIHYYASLSPIKKNGQVQAVIGTCVNISEQKRIARAVEEQNFKYEVITDNMLDLVGMLDKNGKVLYASSSHEKILGFPSNKFVGDSILELIHAEDIRTIEKQFHLMLESKLPCQVELRYKRAEGGWVDIEAKISPVCNKDGEIEYFIAVGREISERRRVEERMIKSEKLSVVGHLASSIAHEIINPLTSIKGFVQLLQNEVNNSLYLDTTLDEIRKIEEIIQEFIEFTKPSISSVEKINITSLLLEVYKLLPSHSNLQSIEIRQEYALDVPEIFCNKNHMKQVFIHILNNAVEAMPNGGIIKINVQRCDDNYIKFSFIDQGYGISKERIKKIGEPFYSINEKGTGLGLMICHKIVQEYGGTIEIKSEINKGTTIDVILPIKYPLAMGISDNLI